jgi:translation elongation factor EF-Tu-like GTPase
MKNIVEVEVRFLDIEISGRQQLPDLKANTYRPHFIVPPDKMMLGVEFVNGPPLILVGISCSATVRLIYAPDVDYSALAVGARFNIVEGPKTVGHGIVLRSA